MNDDDVREEQAAELEAVEAIFGDDYQLLEEATEASGARFQVELADDADADVRMRLMFTHSRLYPRESLHVVAHALGGVSATQRKVLQMQLDEVAAESPDMPAVYAVCEATRDWLAEHVVDAPADGGADDSEQASKFETLDSTQQERVEVISSKSVGTPVNEDTFNRWRDAFLAELAAAMSGDQIDRASDTKMTGREFFESRTVVVSAESASFWESEASQMEAES